MGKIRLGILGATGMGGREALIHQEKLEEKGKNYADLEIVTGSPSSEGRKLGDVFREKEQSLTQEYSFWRPQKCPENFREMEIQGLDAKKIAENTDYVISALPSSIAADIEPELRRSGVNVFSNASQYRWSEEIPLMIPEVNPGDIKMLEEQDTAGVQANNPNCTTAGYVPIIKALSQKFAANHVDLTTMQSISGKGDKIASHEYGSRIKGNAIDDWDAENNHNGEEIKSEIEPKKILGIAETKEEARNEESLSIDAQTTRIPSQYGHLETLRITFEEDVSASSVADTLESWRPRREVRDLPSTPSKPITVLERQPEPRRDVFREDGMTILVGDIRQLDRDRVALYSLSHNLRRGATWTARQSMELYLSKRSVL